MEKDEMKCEGNFEAAMHYDCAECFRHNCPYRKESKSFLLFVALASLIFLGLAIVAILV